MEKGIHGDMNKTLELIEKLKQHPDRELIFMYPEEGSDHYYTLGKPSKVLVDEYAIFNEQVWIKSHDDLAETLGDEIADEMFTYKDFPLNEEQNAIVDAQLEAKMKNLEWKKAIVIYIQPK